MKRKLKTLSAIAAIMLASSAIADTTWTLNTGTTNSGGVSETTTGWANTGSGSSIDNYALQQQTAPNNLRPYSGGVGINNLDGCSSGSTCDVGDLSNTAPEHAIDNEQRYEMVLLSFTSLVNLTGFNIGWKGTDSDMTVLAYTGSGAPTLAGTNWSALSASNSGWSLIGNYANVSTSGTQSTGSSVFSSFWLIGAYNPLAGGTTQSSASSGTLYQGNDYIKLASVTGSVCSNGSGSSCTPPGNNVPEPGSLALLGLGLFGMIGLRRRT